MQGGDIAIADRSKGHKAEVDQFAGDGEIVLQWLHARKCVGDHERDEAEQRHEGKSNHSWATTTDDPTVMPRWGKIGKQKIEDAGTLYPIVRYVPVADIARLV
jgi:hypothetical protein